MESFSYGFEHEWPWSSSLENHEITTEYGAWRVRYDGNIHKLAWRIILNMIDPLLGHFDELGHEGYNIFYLWKWSAALDAHTCCAQRYASTSCFFLIFIIITKKNWECFVCKLFTNYIIQYGTEFFEDYYYFLERKRVIISVMIGVQHRRSSM